MAYNRKQRLNDNIKAIETAFILDREQRTPTARERLLLERYCGFGGLKCILNPARELADAVHWAKSDLNYLLQQWSCIDLSVKTARMKASTNS